MKSYRIQNKTPIYLLKTQNNEFKKLAKYKNPPAAEAFEVQREKSSSFC
jgi:hypothetical protein